MKNIHLDFMIPYSLRIGISTASHGPRAIARACEIPNFGVFFYHRGAKCISKQIFPPLYIFSVLPSSSGSSSSIGVSG